MKRWAPWILAVSFALIVRSVWPRTVEVVSAPRIVTRYDTVRTLDTVHITRTIQRTVFDTTILERVIVAAPETLRILPPRVVGLTFLSVPEKSGDSTIAQGFELVALHDSLIANREWRTQWWTPGPLRVLALDTFPPRVDFGTFAPREKPCRLFCKLGHYGLGAILGAAAWELVR